MNPNEKLTAEEFLKQISPTKDGIRSQLEQYRMRRLVEGIMTKYSEHCATQETRPLLEENEVLKTTNEMLVMDIEIQKKKVQLNYNELLSLQSKVEELEKENQRLKVNIVVVSKRSRDRRKLLGNLALGLPLCYFKNDENNLNPQPNE